jgi:DNA-binding NtrC family response regulator
MLEPTTFTFELPRADGSLVAHDAVELRITAGKDRGLRVELGPSPVVIGSSSRCGVVLHDPAVSAQHAEITLERHGFVLRDLGSKNGVRVGRWLVREIVLGHGLRLGLGQTELRFSALGRRCDVPLAAPTRIGELLAYSWNMRAAVAQLQQLAGADITVLIEGETGTGKELAARALHELSPRRGGPFVIVDCAALTPSLATAELFGHEPGAFTGAAERRPGLFEQAHGGTLFLDEVGELPLELQSPLAGVIERRAARRVGGEGDVAMDVRVVAATNRNLAEEVRAGRFREGLFFRLAAARLRLPPLRERPDDVEALARQFAHEESLSLSAEVLQILKSHRWPGNVRELRNTIARLAASPAELELPLGGPPAGALEPLPVARLRARDAFERDYLRSVIERCGGNLTRAAQLAGVSRSLLMRLAARHKLRLSDRDDAGGA